MNRNLDVILIAIGFVLVVTNAGYLIVKVKPENVRSFIQVMPALMGMVIGWSGMVLMEMKDGKKTVKEAIGTAAVQMLLLGLFILIGTFMQK